MLNAFKNPTADAHTVEADQVRLQPVDEARLVARPAEVTKTWAEAEYDAYASEQPALWEADGLEAARSAATTAAGANVGATELQRQLEGHQSLVDSSRDRHEAAERVLSPFRRREPGAKGWYLTRWGCLLGGDVAGQAGAALAYGEPYVTAMPQALATGMAAVTAGMVGADVRDKHLAVKRQREPDELPEELQPWAHLFTTTLESGGGTTMALGAAASAGLLVSAGIFALRASIDGVLPGLVYGCLSLAIVLASFINAYFYADEIADQIDTAKKTYEKHAKHTVGLAAHPTIRDHERAANEAESITSEHARRGEAAANRFAALKWRALRNNPGVVGHGPAPTEPSAVGRVRQVSRS